MVGVSQISPQQGKSLVVNEVSRSEFPPVIVLFVVRRHYRRLRCQSLTPIDQGQLHEHDRIGFAIARLINCPKCS
jgi:hypothetical protein